MNKFFLITSLLFLSSLIYGQEADANKTPFKTLVSNHSKKSSKQYISINYSIGKNFIKTIQYFKDNGIYKLTFFDSGFLTKELIIENDELFNYINKHLKNFTYLSKNMDHEIFRKYYDLSYDSTFVFQQIGIKYKFLHFNHFILNKNLYTPIDKDEYLKLSYNHLYTLVKYIEEKVKN